MIIERQSLSDLDFNKLSQYVEKYIGIKMPITKKLLLESRLRKRLKVLDLRTYRDYINYLSSKDGENKERQFFIDAVTTNKTDFFRERDHFDSLVSQIIPKLISKYHRNTIKIWSSASSTGEEAYTLGIFLEELKLNRKDFDYTILATDISTEVLSVAKKAVYNKTKLEVIPKYLRNKYFKPTNNSDDFEVCESLKKKVQFGKLNLLSNRYNIPGPFDIIFCRNVFIYFSAERQKQITDQLIGHLKPGGVIFFGHSESMAGMRMDLKSIGSAIYIVK